MKNILYVLLPLILFVSGKTANAQAYSFAPGQLTYSENFDAMGSAGTTFITGWNAIRSSGTGAVGATLTMAVNDGSAISGNIYNVGTTASNERAFGTLASGTTVPRFGAFFANNTGGSITKIDLTGVMEQWRSGSNATVNEVVTFEYSLDATDLQTGTWTPVTSFDLLEKIIGSTTAAALDGNLPENQTALSATISGINWTTGSNLWIRWTDVNDLGSDGLMAIDNLGMTVTTGTVVTLPEPSNYPTSLNGKGAGSNIQLSWTDATGTQVPTGYLIKISTTDNITAPVDGTFTSDDLDLSDGSGAKNIFQGIQKYTFSNLNFATTYYVKVFSYTNSGTLVDYKTDGTVPATNAISQALLYKQDFETGLLAPWTEYSVLGEQKWVTDTIANAIFAKMTGYVSATSTVANEDWLISPSMVIPGGSSPKFEFYSAMSYGTGSSGIAVYVSTDFSSGNPSTSGTWTDLSSQAVFSAGAWAWTSSGFLDLSAYTGTNVHVAFKYTCDAVNAPTWEIDNVFVTNNSGVGFADNSPSTNKTTIYPNPCKDWFKACFPTNDSYRLCIFTNQGTLLLEKEGCQPGTRIDVSKMHTGSYLVLVENLNTHSKEMHKLIVK